MGWVWGDVDGGCGNEDVIVLWIGKCVSFFAVRGEYSHYGEAFFRTIEV